MINCNHEWHYNYFGGNTRCELCGMKHYDFLKLENTQLKAELSESQKSYGDMQSERDIAIYNLQEYVTETHNLKVNVSMLNDENTQLKANLQAVRELLQTIEWVENSTYGYSECPYCEANKEDGHNDCWLKTEIDKLEGME